jgi:hypothetical protein
MTPDNFSTHSLSPRDQLEAWREWFEPVLDVLPKHAAGDEFPAEVHLEARRLGDEPYLRAAR